MPKRRRRPAVEAYTTAGEHRLSEAKMVEAAGVEPASENTSSKTTTCVSPFSMSRPVENGAKIPGRHPR